MRDTANPMRRARRGAWVGLACALCVFASEVAAQTVVYHSPNDNGVNPGTPLQMGVGPSQSLYLWLNAGSNASQSGVACSNGTGRELCGYEVLVTASNGASFVDFIPAPGVVHRLTPSEFRANGLLALNPALGPVRIGQLNVSVTKTGIEVKLQSGVTVLSALQVESIPQRVMATPEPRRWLLLSSGALLVAGLWQRRARSLAGGAGPRR